MGQSEVIKDTVYYEFPREEFQGREESSDRIPITCDCGSLPMAAPAPAPVSSSLKVWLRSQRALPALGLAGVTANGDCLVLAVMLPPNRNASSQLAKHQCSPAEGERPSCRLPPARLKATA